MKCKYSETDLALYVEGDVVSAKACEIQAHLSVCTQCRDFVIELRERRFKPEESPCGGAGFMR
jgi:anti-sigma factor ChrR (cupin superfamily)